MLKFIGKIVKKKNPLENPVSVHLKFQKVDYNNMQVVVWNNYSPLTEKST